MDPMPERSCKETTRKEARREVDITRLVKRDGKMIPQKYQVLAIPGKFVYRRMEEAGMVQEFFLMC